jgi:hypothetical protein
MCSLGPVTGEAPAIARRRPLVRPRLSTLLANRALWLVIGIVAGLIALPLARAGSSEESNLLSRINQERRARGLSPLRYDAQAAGAARRQATRMAQRRSMYHNPNLSKEVSGWRSIGENVGRARSAAGVHSMMMGSSYHRGNILGRYGSVGVGAVWAHGWLWVSEVFVLRLGAPPAPAPAPKPAPKLRITAESPPKPKEPPRREKPPVKSPPPPRPSPSPEPVLLATPEPVPRDLASAHRPANPTVPMGAMASIVLATLGGALVSGIRQGRRGRRD